MPTNYRDPVQQPNPYPFVKATSDQDSMWSAIGGAFSDPFTADTASAGGYDVTDYAYGGSLAAQQAQQDFLTKRGQTNYGTLAEAGNSDYVKPVMLFYTF